jgi:hypothetical protein
LADLQLFSVVLREANDWSHLTNVKVDAQLSAFLETLVGNNRSLLLSVFESYAAQDSGAAFRLAEDCGIDLAIEAPALLVACCINPPFLDIAAQHAGEPSEEATRWREIVVEAGLTYAFVASMLQRRRVPNSWSESLSRVPRDGRWDLRRTTPIILPALGPVHVGADSRYDFFTAAVTLVVNSSDGGHDGEFPKSEALRSIKGPRTGIQRRTLRLLSYVSMCAGAVLALRLAISSIFWVGPVLIATLILSRAMTKYAGQRESLYSIACQVDVSGGYEWASVSKIFALMPTGIARIIYRRLHRDSYEVLAELAAPYLNREVTFVHSALLQPVHTGGRSRAPRSGVVTD